MVGKRTLTALCCASALLLTGAGTAFAADDGVPFQKLVEVTVPTRTHVDSVVEHYDAAEYKRVEGDGIVLNVFVTAEEEGSLKAAGYTIGRTIEDSNTGSIRMEQRQQVLDEEALAADLAENGMPKGGTKFQGKSVVPTPGDTVIQRANTFTDVVGPSGGTTTARFLYVEAFNKSTKVTGTTTVTGPTLALTYAGADGVYNTTASTSVASSTPIRRRTSTCTTGS